MNKKKYIVDKKNKNKMDSVKTITIEGYSLASKNHRFVIKGETVSNIVVSDEELIKKLVVYKVEKKYRELIKKATDILTDDDDDTADGAKLVLDEVEKFRQEIKIKYRQYLEKDRLNMMAKQLTIIKKTATAKELEIREVFLENQKESKSK